MGNQNIVRDVPTSNKSILERGDEDVHKRLKPINHELGNHFIQIAFSILFGLGPCSPKTRPNTGPT